MTQTISALPLRQLQETMRRRAGLLALVGLSGLAACSSPAPPSVPPEPAVVATPAPEPIVVAPVEPPAPARPTLAAEQRRLAALFRGTPVVFSMQPDGRLRVDIPLRHSFDTGRASVKAPLAAVLDRVALSQAGGSSRIVVTAAGDRITPATPAASSAPATAAARAAPAASAAAAARAASSASTRQERLAGERSKSVVDRLVAKGIAPGRLSASPGGPAGQSVRLSIDDRPAP